MNQIIGINMTKKSTLVGCLLILYACCNVAGKAVEKPLNDAGVRSSRALPGADAELGASPWHASAQASLREHLAKIPDTRKAKNVILFLGDGMSVATVSAARVLHGQRLGQSGEEYKLSFEEFPYTGLSKTYCVDKQVADSACSATAYLTGVKANYGTLGVTAAVPRKECAASADSANHVSSIAVWAQQAGMATGIVTTTRVTHASPSGTYAHTAERDWEADSDVIASNVDPKICPDIATQLINSEPGKNFKVILGGGRKNFFPNSTIDEEGSPGVRADGVDLVAAWKQSKLINGYNAAYVTDRDALLAATSSKTDFLLGLFDADHMQYHLDADSKTEPTLAEMTASAIKILSKENNGFFLFVEGGRIDHGHHNNLAQKALDETVELSKAVSKAVSMLDDDSLLVITADHAHTMSYAGYARRGSDIMGMGGQGSDGLPYTTLAYANGPSYAPQINGTRHNLTMDDLHNVNYTFPAPVPMDSETHGGEDVEVFATGPWSHLFTGIYEQNVIPHLMAFAACIGPGLKACDDDIYGQAQNHQDLNHQ